MPKISKLELVVINLLSPLDVLQTRIASWFDESTKPRSWRFVKKYKSRSYQELLIQLIEKGYDESFVKDYMRSPCGRLQIKLAIARGIMSSEEYSKLKKGTSMFHDFIQYYRG